MERPEREEWLTAAECAARTGLTVRALRVYEDHGLIEPKRSASDWRQYGADDLVRLNTITLLKTAGLSLAQIREVTKASPEAPTLQQILEIQLVTWDAPREDAERGHAITQTALETVRRNQPLSVDELCDVIRSLEMTQTSAATPSADKEKQMDEITLDRAVLDRYVGFYAPNNGEFGFHTITRSAEKLVQEVLGQPPFDLCPSRGDRVFRQRYRRRDAD